MVALATPSSYRDSQLLLKFSKNEEGMFEDIVPCNDKGSNQETLTPLFRVVQFQIQLLTHNNTMSDGFYDVSQPNEDHKTNISWILRTGICNVFSFAKSPNII